MQATTSSGISWGDHAPVELPECFRRDGEGPFIWIVWDVQKVTASTFPTKEAIAGQVGTAGALVDLMEEQAEPWPSPSGTLHVVARNPNWDEHGTATLPGVEPPARWIHSQARIAP